MGREIKKPASEELGLMVEFRWVMGHVQAPTSIY